MRYDSPQDKIYNIIFRDRTPITRLIILANIITFLLVVLFKVNIIVDLFAYDSASAIKSPWTLFTYPLLGTFSLMCLVFADFWLLIAGGSLERSWGSTRFAAFFFSVSAISVFSLLIGSLMLGTPTSAIGLWLPLAGVTIAFAMINPEQQILFMFIIPLKLKYLAIISAALIFIEFGKINLPLGLLSLIGCAFSYWYVKKPTYTRQEIKHKAEVVRVFEKPKTTGKLNPFKWAKERKERKKLEKLFKDSGIK